MNALKILVGNIGSGKSEFSKFEVDKGSLIVSDDAIVNAVHGYNYYYNKNCKALYKTIENSIVTYGLSNGLDVVIDRPNLTPESRRRFLGLASSFDVRSEVYLFKMEDPSVHANRRYNHDDRGYLYTDWLDVATQNHNKYIRPSYTEGIDMIYCTEFKDGYFTCKAI